MTGKGVRFLFIAGCFVIVSAAVWAGGVKEGPAGYEEGRIRYEENGGVREYEAGSLRLVLERVLSWHSPLPDKAAGGYYNSETGVEFAVYESGRFTGFLCVVKKANVRAAPGGAEESSFRDIILVISPDSETEWVHREFALDPGGDVYVSFGSAFGGLRFVKTASGPEENPEFRIFAGADELGYLGLAGSPGNYRGPRLFFNKDYNGTIDKDLKDKVCFCALAVYESFTRERNEFFPLPGEEF